MADKDSRTGARYADADILDYVSRVHATHDAALEEAFSAPEREQMPSIQVGRSEGRLLELLARMVGAQRVVEVGTLAGYSAIRLARGLSEGGRLWTLESNAEHAAVARAMIDNAELGDRVEVVVGAALELLPGLVEHGPFDLVFIDADKENYDRYGEWAADNLRPGGLMVADNAFLFGKLLEDTVRGRAMRRFHERAAERFDSVCVPTPDGMLVGIKRA